MKKTTFVLPLPSPFAAAAAEEARASGREPALGRLAEPPASQRPAGDSEGAARADNAPEAIVWNPLSFASARAAIIEAENALGSALAEVVLVADPPRDEPSLLELPPAQLEKRALTWIAGYAHFAREAIKALASRGGGTLALCIAAAEGRGPIGAMAVAALEALALNLLAQSQAGTLGPCRFIAVKDESGNPETLARAIIRALDDGSRNAGKLIRTGGKSFFSK